MIKFLFSADIETVPYAAIETADGNTLFVVSCKHVARLPMWLRQEISDCITARLGEDRDGDLAEVIDFQAAFAVRATRAADVVAQT
jgi:hypothetical protein